MYLDELAGVELVDSWSQVDAAGTLLQIHGVNVLVQPYMSAERTRTLSLAVRLAIQWRDLNLLAAALALGARPATTYLDVDERLLLDWPAGERLLRRSYH